MRFVMHRRCHFFSDLTINLLEGVGRGGAFGFNTGGVRYDNFSFETNDFSIFVMIFLSPGLLVMSTKFSYF